MAPLLTYRAVARYLRSIGATYLRTSGTHEQWKLPNGHRITVPVPHGAAGRKAWDPRLSRMRWRELEEALGRTARDTAWGRYRGR
jgi:predicted RNA binding protein YcfA (HicA-like mRNA interferase family)